MSNVSTEWQVTWFQNYFYRNYCRQYRRLIQPVTARSITIIEFVRSLVLLSVILIISCLRLYYLATKMTTARNIRFVMRQPTVFSERYYTHGRIIDHIWYKIYAQTWCALFYCGFVVGAQWIHVMYFPYPPDCLNRHWVMMVPTLAVYFLEKNIKCIFIKRRIK